MQIDRKDACADKFAHLLKAVISKLYFKMIKYYIDHHHNYFYPLTFTLFISTNPFSYLFAYIFIDLSAYLSI